MSNNVQEVQLTPLNGGPGHNWNVGHDGKNGSDPSTYPIVSLPEKSGPYIVHFTIQGPGSIKFASTDPVWVQAGSKPTTSVLDAQVAGVVQSADGRELFVLDKNSGNNAQLYYRLNFNGHGFLDPIIDNGGGNFMVFSTLQYVEAGIGLLAAFAIGLLVQKRFRLF